jgi:nucleoside-diphosphate-sugar epimerase
LDISFAKRELRWKPKYNLENGLRTMVKNIEKNVKKFKI